MSPGGTLKKRVLPLVLTATCAATLAQATADAAEIRISGLKTHRTFVIASAPELSLPQLAIQNIPSSVANVRCRAGGKRCVIRIQIEAGFSGPDNTIVSVCPLVDDVPVQNACLTNGEITFGESRHSVLAFVTRKPGSKYKISFRVFSSSATSKLRKFSAEYTTLYK